MMRRLWWAGAILALALALGAWLAPYALSLYHLEAGGRALDAALIPVCQDWLAPEQVVDAERLEAGRAHLHEALRWDPRNVQALRSLARTYLTQGQPELALEVLEQALTVRPANPLLYLELGDVYDSLGQTELAIEAYETGGVGSRGVPLAVNYLKLADAKAQSGGGDVAIALWRKALQVNPGNLYALYRLAQIHRDLGDEEHAAMYEEQSRHFDSRSVAISPDFRLVQYQGQAMAALVDDGLWERETLLNVVSYQVSQSADGVSGQMIERVLQTLLEQWPEDADLLYYLAELYCHWDDLERAEAAYRQVLAVNPDYAQAHLRLGTVAEAKSQIPNLDPQEQLEEAAGWYERYLVLVPDDLLGLKRLAGVCVALRDGGVEDESCHRAADRVMGEPGREGEIRSPAAVLWAKWLEQVATADLEYPVGQEFDSGWIFLGYDVDEDRLIRGEPVDLLLYWMGPALVDAGSEGDGWYRAGERWVQVLEGVQNLIPNGGFEMGMEDGSPAGFPVDVYQADPETRRLVLDSWAGQRTTVALLDNTKVYSNTSFASTYVPISPDGLYLQAGWIKSVGGNGYLGRCWAGDIVDAPCYSYVAAGVNPDDWQHYAGVTRPLEGANRCQIWLLNYKSVGQVYFDNVLFVGVGLPGE